MFHVTDHLTEFSACRTKRVSSFSNLISIYIGLFRLLIYMKFKIDLHKMSLLWVIIEKLWRSFQNAFLLFRVYHIYLHVACFVKLTRIRLLIF
jgi:hypothetical protein